MKKTYFVPLLFAVVHCCLAQVQQKKINATLPATTTVKPATSGEAQNNDATKTIINAPVSNIKVTNIIPLNSKSPAYNNYASGQKKINIPGYNSPVFSKQYSFSDGTGMKVAIQNANGIAVIRRSNIANPQPLNTGKTDDGQNTCTTVKLALTADSKTFMNNNYAGQAHFIYPGAIYNSADLFNGNFSEVNAGRSPVVLTVDNHNMTGNSYEVVQNPDGATLPNAVTQLWQRFTTDPRNTGQENLSENVYEAGTAADMAIKMGVDASGYGGSFSAYYGTQKDQKTEYLAIDCIKPMFTVSVALPDSGYFKKDANTNLSNLVVIGAVTYGSRVLANVKANFSSTAEQAGFSAGYSGWGVQANANLDFFSSNNSVDTTINAYYVGGPGGTKPSFNKQDLKTEVLNFFGSSNYQNAMPISYELYDLNGNVLGVYTATDAFNIPLCIPKDVSNASLDCSADPGDKNASYAYVKTGNNSGDNKDPDTHWSFGLMDNNGNAIASFHDDKNNDPYNNGTTTDKLYLKTQNGAVFSNFVNSNGGRIHINIAPNGNDAWNIDEFTIFLNFINPGIAPQKLTWNSIGLNEGKRDTDLTFHYDKTTNSFIADANY